ncbi:hypothetical protein OA871_03715 [Paracoccaceae bacterium]|nr:hypothetical protein [Paracoccaceae bacterium]
MPSVRSTDVSEGVSGLIVVFLHAKSLKDGNAQLSPAINSEMLNKA